MKNEQTRCGHAHGRQAPWRVTIALVGAVGLTVAGCAGGEPSGPTAPSPTSQAQAQPFEAAEVGLALGQAVATESVQDAGVAAATPSAAAGVTGSKTGQGSSSRAASSSGAPPSSTPGRDGKPDSPPGGGPTLQRRPAPDLTDEQIRRAYPDDVEPGKQVTATLCNLTRGHMELLESRISGPDGVNDQHLQLALISLGDDLGVWEGITWHLPEAAADIDIAREVYARWELALAQLHSGNVDAAQEQLAVASTAIDSLPEAREAHVGCGN